jgi:hypothetical protein
VITPADSPSSPEQFNAVPVSSFNIQAEQQNLAAAVEAAGRLAGAGVVYPQGPRQAETVTMLQSPQGFGSNGYDIDAGYSGTWPADVEPTVAGP